MGLEANTLCHKSDESYEVKAILESRELILRGALKIRILLSDIKNPIAENDYLQFDFNGENYRLELVKNDAQKWHKKIIMPPKTLAQKFGINSESKIHSMNAFSSDEVNLALQNCQFEDLENAQIIFAQFETIDKLEFIHKKIANLSINFAIWLIYPKGKNVILKESDIRQYMRQNGFMDNKISAIDDVFTATRYARVKELPQLG